MATTTLHPNGLPGIPFSFSAKTAAPVEEEVIPASAYERIILDDHKSAIVVNVENTGPADTAYSIVHGLGRVPIGCYLQLKDKTCDIYKGSIWDNNAIEVKFTAENANVNIRIW